MSMNKKRNDNVFDEEESDGSDSYDESVLINSMRELSIKKSAISEEKRKSKSDETKEDGIEYKVMKPIDHRIEFIKNVLDESNLKPMVDFDNCETENYSDGKVSKKIINIKELCKSMGLKLEYIKSGTTGHTFKGSLRDDPSIAFAFKVCAYPKGNYGSINKDSRPENAELRVLKLLSYFVVTKNSPHFVLPVTTFNTSINTFVKIPKSIVDIEDKQNGSYREFVEKYYDNKFEDFVSVLISEWANGGDLLDYIRNNYEKMTLRDWKVIFFQILFTLALIQIKYPTFRHNDMKANNILVQLTQNTTENKYYSYKIDKYKFIIPDIGIQIKIWDFDFASVDGIIENDKVNTKWANRINVTKKQNKYYDMHYFFNTLSSKRFFPQFREGGAPQDIVDFIERVIPPKFRKAPRLFDKVGNPMVDDKGKPVYDEQNVNAKGRIQINTEYTTPFKVITEDPLFEKNRFLNTDYSGKRGGSKK